MRATGDMTLLTQGLAAMELDVDEQAKQRLLDLSALISKWNQVYNLTAIKDPQQIIIRHLLDSLTLLPRLHRCKSCQVIDVGTGAGLPGLPLAIVSPDVNFVLLDSNAKKTRFIVQAVSELGLKNITIETARVEAYQPKMRFDTVISRAVSSVSELVNKSAHLCAENAYFLFMKGAYPTEELECIPDGVIVRSVERVNVPGLDAQRHIICMQRAPAAK